MQWDEVILEIQIDMTTYCNAACLACARHQSETGKLHQGLKLQHFDRKLWNRLCEKDFKEIGVKTLFFNGNWGDACMHPDLVPMIEYCLHHNPEICIKISTNGSLRTKKWWTALANVLNWRCNVVFCIDGLEDTHKLYREKTSYSKVVENMRAFNDAGGYGIWMFTVFDHNIHQIDEAARLAKEYGCAVFRARKSNSNDMENQKGEVFTADLPIPDKHKKRKKFKEIWYAMDGDIIRGFSEERKKTPCTFYKEASVQIDPFGTLWPCCWISLNSLGHDKWGRPNETVQLRDTSLSDKLNLKHRSIKQILQDPWYNKELATGIKEKTWNLCNEQCIGPHERMENADVDF